MKGIKIPSSKFDTIALILLAHLCKGKSIIKEANLDQEVLEVIKIFIKNFESNILIDGNNLVIQGIKEKLEDEVFLNEKPDDIFYFQKEHHLAFSIFLAFSCLFNSQCVFSIKDKSARNKNYKSYITALKMLKCQAESTKGNDTLPIIKTGAICAGNTSIDTDNTSEFLSALFLILPLCKNHSVIETNSLKKFTEINFIRNFFEAQGINFFFNEWHYFVINGFQEYKNFDLRINADEKLLAFFLTTQIIMKKNIIIKNANLKNKNHSIIPILKDFGYDFKIDDDENIELLVNNNPKEIQLNLIKNPDFLFIVLFLACVSNGVSKISIKNSQSDTNNLLEDIKYLDKSIIELNKLGAKIEVNEHSLEIKTAKFDFLKESVKLNAFHDENLSFFYLLLFLTGFTNLKIINIFDFEKTYLNFNGTLYSIIEEQNLKEKLKTILI